MCECVYVCVCVCVCARARACVCVRVACAQLYAWKRAWEHLQEGWHAVEDSIVRIAFRPIEGPVLVGYRADLPPAATRRTK